MYSLTFYSLIPPHIFGNFIILFRKSTCGLVDHFFLGCFIVFQFPSSSWTMKGPYNILTTFILFPYMCYDQLLYFYFKSHDILLLLFRAINVTLFLPIYLFFFLVIPLDFQTFLLGSFTFRLNDICIENSGQIMQQ